MGLYIYFSIGLFFWLTAIIIFFRAHEKAFYFLAGHLIIMGVGILTRSMQYNGLMPGVPHFYGVLFPLQFLYGPFYLFFLIKLFNRKFTFKLVHILHFIPFLFNLVDYIPFFVLSPDQKRQIIQAGDSLSFFGIEMITYEYLKLFSYVFYLFCAVRFYLRYIYFTQISDRRHTQLIHYWLRFDFILKVIGVASVFFLNVVNTQQSFTNAYYLFSLHIVLNALIVYFKPSLMNGIAFEQSQQLVKKSFSIAQVRHYLAKLFKVAPGEKELADRIYQVFELRRMYTDSECSLAMLSEKTGVSEEQLLEYIRQTYHCSWDDFIAFKRLENLCNSFPDISINHLITSTIFQTGFDSITSFQATLSAYLRSDKKDLFMLQPETVVQLKDRLEVILVKDK